MSTPEPPPPEVVDPADVLGDARRAQAQFEIRRQRYLPLAWAGGGGACDERVGRFCTWYDEGEWVPVPEAPAIASMRDSLLAYLDAAQDVLPGEGWLLGQRVWYRSEAGRWAEALSVARRCRSAEAWWCAALEGFALHGSERFEEAERAFDRALAAMEEERARRWRSPEASLARDAREVLRRAVAAGDEGVLERIWTLADPLFLVPGNDRKTEHYSRWTVVSLRERARNPFQMSWGRDLEELTLRHGWEMGWERSRPEFAAPDGVVGHKHPEGRDYMPSAHALVDPGGASPEDLRADRTRPRSLYAPAYAPVLLPIDPQVAAFPRGSRIVVVASHPVPEDTTGHARHGHLRPWMEPPDSAASDRGGLFLVPAGAGPTLGRAGEGGAGASVVEAPAGAYVLSVESWSPSRRIAGRLRRGFRRDTLPEDAASLSDLLFVRSGATEIPSLEAAAARALPGLRIGRGTSFGVAWEVRAPGLGASTLEYEIFVERTDRGFLRRAVERLGILDRDSPFSLSWEEPGVPGGRTELRWVDLELPPLDPGTYRVRLAVTAAGGRPLESEVRFGIVSSN